MTIHEANANGPSITKAARGREIVGIDMFKSTSDNISATRVVELMSQMNADVPKGGEELSYGDREAHRIRYWRTDNAKAPLVIFIHGGSWRSGTYLDSVGALKVRHLIDKGYAFASVNYTLVPIVTVEEQVKEVADAVGYMLRNGMQLGSDPERVVLMGHSSGAHVATLLGTDATYLARVNLELNIIHGVVALDGSNYNAAAEIIDSPGPVADSTISGLGSDLQRLNAMSPLYHAHAPNARAFLLLQVQRQGDIRQAVELSAALNAAGTEAALHVFEGESFEGHMAMLLRIGDPHYPATQVLDDWLACHVPSQ
ncbi:alpha/beta-hydrolase [Phaeosphaeriaceae sp. SRC1lsM3a]|nr:alpha/beta-hydrolase [Stagonospora sp. SRC1lsM3a]